MATNQTEQRRVPDQSEYEDATQETTWADLEDGPGSFEVAELPPLRLLRDMTKYNVAGLLGGGDDQDEIDMGELVRSGDFSAFLENTVLPNILQPTCYWDPDDDGDPIGDGDFDLASLTADDLMIVITGMTGQDQEDLQERMDDQFQG